MRLQPTLCLPVLLLATALGGCSVLSPKTVFRGEAPDPRDVAELVPGVSTKADVQVELGSPTNVPAFDDNTWLYLGQQTHIRIARTPGIAKQSVTVVKFDQSGVLASIDTENAPNGMQMAMAGGATKSPGSEASLLGQIIGNIGRFSPSGGSGSGSSSPLSGFASTSSSALGQGGTTSGATQ